MPELPEVETMVLDLRPRVVGRRIARARLSHDDILRGVTKSALLKGLRGATVQSITRRAKHAVLDLGGRRLVVQPGMTGNLLHYARPLTDAEAKYAVLRAEIDDGTELVYRDIRRIGTLLWLDERDWRDYDAALGPEPLDPALDAARFGRIFAGSKQAVKKVAKKAAKKVVRKVATKTATKATKTVATKVAKKPAPSSPRKRGSMHLQRTLDSHLRGNDGG